MASRLSAGLIDFQASKLKEFLDGGNTILECRTGAQPGSANNAPTGTVLFSISLPNPAVTGPSGGNGTLTKTGTWQDPTADANGVAGWVRLRKTTDGGGSSTTDQRMDGSVTLPGGGGEVILDNTNITIGQQITIQSGSFVQNPTP